MPFFYWFQTLWLVCCSGFYMGFAYLMGGEGREGRGGVQLSTAIDDESI
jgi:hypothetical protein